MNRLKLLTILPVAVATGCGQGTTEPEAIPYEAELLAFLTSEVTDQNIVQVAAAPLRSLDPSRPVEVATFTTASGAVLYRSILTNENMPYTFIPIMASADYYGIGEDDVCILEDSRDLPTDLVGPGRLLINIFHSRNKEIRASVECAQAKLEGIEEGSGCGLFMTEIRNEETGVLDLHATVLCPD